MFALGLYKTLSTTVDLVHFKSIENHVHGFSISAASPWMASRMVSDPFVPPVGSVIDKFLAGIPLLRDIFLLVREHA